MVLWKRSLFKKAQSLEIPEFLEILEIPPVKRPFSQRPLLLFPIASEQTLPERTPV